MRDKPLSRRALLARCALLLLPSFGRAEIAVIKPSAQIKALEVLSGTRIGVAALDTASGRTLFHREKERFLFCSTWKFLVVAALLARVDRGEENLNRLIHYQPSDLVPYAPVTTRHLESGLTLAALAEAAMTVSDNAAANLLLTAVGGFNGFNRFVQSLNDEITVLSRDEPAVNVPDGAKDTTTPLAMLGDMECILLGPTLKPASRKKMLDWLMANTTGGTMLRAGLPVGWAVGDKTGHGDSAMNDIAIVIPPGRKPVLIAAYTRHGPGSTAQPDLLAKIGKIVAETFPS